MAGDINRNRGPRRQPANCRVLCFNIRGFDKTLKDHTMAAIKHDIVFSLQTLVSNITDI